MSNDPTVLLDETPSAVEVRHALRGRVHALELANVLLREDLRLCLPYVEQGRPRHFNEPLCDSEGCVRCQEIHQWRKAIETARAALGE